MLVIGLGIGLIIAGLVALIRGQLKLSQKKAVQGIPARLLGVALMTPLPLGFLAAMVYMLMNVDPNRPDQVEQWNKDNEMTLSLIVAGVEIGLALIIIIIAAFLAKPLPRDGGRSAGRADRDYDDYEDEARPRRKRDGAQDRPRQRRAADYDDDEDDRPRRRDDLDDRAR